MKKSDLIDIALKLFGLNLLIECILSLKDVFHLTFTELVFESSIKATNYILPMLIGYLVSSGIQLLIGIILIVRSKKIAGKMISSGEDSAADFAIDKVTGMEIAAVVVGGFLLTKGVSSLGYYIIQLIQSVQAQFEVRDKGIANIAWAVVTIFLGYILIAARSFIAKHFTR